MAAAISLSSSSTHPVQSRHGPSTLLPPAAASTCTANTRWVGLLQQRVHRQQQVVAVVVGTEGHLRTACATGCLWHPAHPSVQPEQQQAVLARHQALPALAALSRMRRTGQGSRGLGGHGEVAALLLLVVVVGVIQQQPVQLGEMQMPWLRLMTMQW